MIVAAGGGRRIGAPEALLRLGDKTLVERAVGILREAGCDPVVVVLGAAADRVRESADLAEATVVVDRAWGRGLGSSLRKGLKALSTSTAEAAVVMPVDMPGVTPAAVRRVAALPYPEALVCATYDGVRGYPMLFGRRHWAGIVTLANADVGARPYLLAHKDEIVDISCDSVADGRRVDKPELVTTFGLTVPELSDAKPAETAEPAGVAEAPLPAQRGTA
jgi:CTP:molybdopterin cytidylyltransferase MocA